MRIKRTILGGIAATLMIAACVVPVVGEVGSSHTAIADKRMVKEKGADNHVLPQAETNGFPSLLPLCFWDLDWKPLFAGNTGPIYHMGKVGVGTSSPATELHVDGTVHMTGFEMPTGAQDGYILTSDASGVGTWMSGGAGGDNDWAWSSGSGLTGDIYHSGYVGIGTDNPATNLDIANENYPIAIRLSNTLWGGTSWTIQNNGGLEIKSYHTIGPSVPFMKISAGHTHVDIEGVDDTGSTVHDAVELHVDGSVGIGTDSPDSRLDVALGTVSNVYEIYSGPDNINQPLRLFGSGDLTFVANSDGNGPSSAFHWCIDSEALVNEKMRLTKTGLGVGLPSNTNPERTCHIKDVLRLEPRSTEPSNPGEGDIYVNGNNHNIYCYLGGVWKQLDN